MVFVTKQLQKILIACKKTAGGENEEKSTRGIYRFICLLIQLLNDFIISHCCAN